MSDIKERTFKFAVRIIKMVEALPKTTAGYAIGNQVIRSGTAIGAILEEAAGSLSYNDFIKSLRESRKEAKETSYWIRLIIEIELMKVGQLQPLLIECREIIRILSKSIKTSEERQPQHKIKRRKS